MPQLDTIVAIATPPGQGGVGIVRVCGAGARALAEAVMGKLPAPRYAVLACFRDAARRPIDHGIALFFPAPHSFTGEDTIELHGHGGPVVLDMLVKRCVELGARLARPGEFSERAFLNGKLDLAQAEAVADLIESSSETAARSAIRSLEGEFSRHIHGIVDALIELRMHVEAAIDFPEEEIDFLADARIQDALSDIASRIDRVMASAEQGCLLRDGMTVVLAGRPNAGKSSLLNALVERESAIVSTTPGTTRDVLREQIQLDGMPVHVIDTAGLRESRDEIESEGVRRAQQAIGRADRVLLIVDDSQTDVADLNTVSGYVPEGLPCTLVLNKIDLTGRAEGLTQTDRGVQIALSAKTGGGLSALRDHLKACMGFQAAGEGTFMARRRHLEAIARARQHLAVGQAQLVQRRAGELLAEELRLAQQSLGEITGEFSSDDLLGRIFSRFCIGK